MRVVVMKRMGTRTRETKTSRSKYNTSSIVSTEHKVGDNHENKGQGQEDD
jgi:hypothetical protein